MCYTQAHTHIKTRQQQLSVVVWNKVEKRCLVWVISQRGWVYKQSMKSFSPSWESLSLSLCPHIHSLSLLEWSKRMNVWLCFWKKEWKTFSLAFNKDLCLSQLLILIHTSAQIHTADSTRSTPSEQWTVDVCWGCSYIIHIYSRASPPLIIFLWTKTLLRSNVLILHKITHILQKNIL